MFVVIYRDCNDGAVLSLQADSEGEQRGIFTHEQTHTLTIKHGIKLT